MAYNDDNLFLVLPNLLSASDNNSYDGNRV